MKIQCTIIRKGGTHATIGTTEYHFKPNEHDDHVADVSIENHIARFLAVPESFQPYDADAKAAAAELAEQIAAARAPAAPEAPDSDDDTLTGTGATGDDSTVSKIPPGFTPTYRIGEHTYDLNEVIRAAQAAEGIDIATWNDLTDGGRADIIEGELDAIENGESEATHMPPPEQTAEVRTPEEKHADAVAAYKAKFGRAPNGRSSTESILAKLAEG